jgi:hypothetical protein
MRDRRNSEQEEENFAENPRKSGISTVELQGIGRCIPLRSYRDREIRNPGKLML